jgi:hypothetical protein
MTEQEAQDLKGEWNDVAYHLSKILELVYSLVNDQRSELPNDLKKYFKKLEG